MMYDIIKDLLDINLYGTSTSYESYVMYTTCVLAIVLTIGVFRVLIDFVKAFRRR